MRYEFYPGPGRNVDYEVNKKEAENDSLPNRPNRVPRPCNFTHTVVLVSKDNVFFLKLSICTTTVSPVKIY
jgi:hypothetical protein